jgi:hypothetical protein
MYTTIILYTDHHDITAILLKVVFNTITLPSKLVSGETRNQQLGKLGSSISAVGVQVLVTF